MTSYLRWSCVLLAIYFLQSCSYRVINIQTSIKPPTENSYGRYYLPRKMMDCAVTYTVTYKDFYEPELHPTAKRHFQKKPNYSRAEIFQVKASDDIPITFHIEYDPTRTYWLSSSDRLDLISLTYADAAPGVLKSVNGAFTPPGEAVATTTLKVASVVVTAVAGALMFVNYNPLSNKDSTSTNRTEQVVIKKTIDIAQTCSHFKHEETYCNQDSIKTVAVFDSKDLKIASRNGVFVPIVSLSVKRGILPNSGESLPQDEQIINATPVPNLFSYASKPLKGVLYRRPAYCDVFATIQRNPVIESVSFSTQIIRTSFPQLGRIAVAPLEFRKGFLAGGKRTAMVSFNTDGGGLIEYKQERARGTGTAATEGGNLTKALLGAYGDQRKENSELQKLKEENELLEEKNKLIENQQKYNSLHP